MWCFSQQQSFENDPWPTKTPRQPKQNSTLQRPPSISPVEASLKISFSCGPEQWPEHDIQFFCQWVGKQGGQAGTREDTRCVGVIQPWNRLHTLVQESAFLHSMFLSWCYSKFFGLFLLNLLLCNWQSRTLEFTCLLTSQFFLGDDLSNSTAQGMTPSQLETSNAKTVPNRIGPDPMKEPTCLAAQKRWANILSILFLSSSCS